MKNLLVYKTLPSWNSESLPIFFQQKHNTKVGTWAKLHILKGTLSFAWMTEEGETTETFEYNATRQPPLIEPQKWHRIALFSEDLECELSFLCTAEDYYAKKYNLTPTHSEIINAIHIIPTNKPLKALDLGCGSGRNPLYLNSKGYNVTAIDKNSDSIARLNHIIEKENLNHIKTAIEDLNNYQINDQFDFIFSTVVLMFLNPTQIPRIINNVQQNTRVGGYNLIVAAINSDDYPFPASIPMPFSFLFEPMALRNFYDDWEIIKYNEDVGELHKTDHQGNKIKLRFATLLARKKEVM